MLLELEHSKVKSKRDWRWEGWIRIPENFRAKLQHTSILENVSKQPEVSMPSEKSYIYKETIWALGLEIDSKAGWSLTSKKQVGFKL